MKLSVSTVPDIHVPSWDGTTIKVEPSAKSFADLYVQERGRPKGFKLQRIEAVPKDAELWEKNRSLYLVEHKKVNGELTTLISLLAGYPI